MFGSIFIEIAIALVFFYVLLSIVCSGLNEILAQFLHSRAKTLEKGILRLIGDEKIREQFYKHPLIKSLGQEPSKGGTVKPSYIPSRDFALALLSAVAPAKEKPGEEPNPGAHDQTMSSSVDEQSFNEIWSNVAKLPDADIRTALLTLIDASDRSIKKVRKNIEDWYDSAMERVSGWYKRRVQIILLILSSILIVAMNADTIAITKGLWQSSVLRQEMVTSAGSYIEGIQDIKKKGELVGSIQRLQDLALPFGWSVATAPKTFGEGLLKFLGLIITVFAVSMGAPFWFDLLNKVTNLRGAGRVPEKSKET
ncbi:MAG: hypothetical protein ACMUIL_01770 [bacterium]